MLRTERFYMHHKDMEVWKQAMELVYQVYKIVETFPKEELYGLTSQIKRCVISIPSNIAEGWGGFSNKETSRFITISLGSLAELDTQLLIAQHLHFVDDITEVSKQVDKVNALLVGLKKYLEKDS